MNKKGRSNNSLSETSMMMVANIIKLSSFSIAQMSLGTAPKKLPSLTGSNTILNNNPSVPQFSGSLKSQEPHSVSKPVSYLIEPVEGNGSLYVMPEEKGIDEKTLDYIRKVHEKNWLDSNKSSMKTPFILPPPPGGAM